MAEKSSVFRGTDLPAHPAVRAWNALTSGSDVPTQIVILKRKGGSHVCLLRGLTADGRDVVAKRSAPAKGASERRIYELCLPRLPVSAVRYYGALEVDGGEHLWLFVGPAEGEKYSSRLDENRQLAAEWLARLHTSAHREKIGADLPSRLPDLYLARLRSAHDGVLRGRKNPALSPDDLETLAEVTSQCDVLRSRWDDVERLCARSPRTLVHGDFAPKNMRVRTSPAGRELSVFDWGTAGWGVPAADLVQAVSAEDRYWVSPDLGTYGSLVRDDWPELDAEALRALAAAGKIFRTLFGLDGDARSLATSWVEQPMANIRRYRDHLAEAFAVAGLSAARPAAAESPNPLDHPAVRAWNGGKRPDVVPESITTLDEGPGSRVFAVRGLPAEGCDLVAKQTSREAAQRERNAYERILPHLSLPALRFHGLRDDGDGDRAWIFLERARGEPYSPSVPEHRALAARWLASLHTRAQKASSLPALPDRGPDRYLAHLRSTREKIERHFRNPVLTPEDRRGLEKTIARLDETEAGWSRVTAVVARGPRTLIHGDFAPKNMRVHPGDEGPELRVFDWEHAGWGTPAADLVQWRRRFERDWASADLELYGSLVRETWPDLDEEVIRALADAGEVFRLLVWCDGDATSLATRWVEQAVGNLEIYEGELAEAAARLP